MDLLIKDIERGEFVKKILLLGGSTQQISAITYANSQGYYTVLCDYLIDNPGQYYAKKILLYQYNRQRGCA